MDDQHPAHADAAPLTAEEEDAAVAAEDRRAFDRLVNFTDAVVAIALTLQLLPIVEIPGPKDGETIWQVFAANSAQIYAFLLSFLLVVIMWVVHNRIFNVMQRYDSTILWLNIGWMLSIAFLPWPTAMYGEAGSSFNEGASGVGLLYWLNLAVISAFGSLIAFHAARHPDLLQPGAQSRGWLAQRRRARLRGLMMTLYFAFIGIVSEFLPDLAPWLAFGLIVIGRVFSTEPKSSRIAPRRSKRKTAESA